jgi:hypothetical protein
MSSIAEVFPPEDPVARFMVVMSMARNDVEHALFEAVKVQERGDEGLLNYWSRITTAHFFEGVHALHGWRQLPEIRAFIAKLPREARDDLKAVERNVQTMGSDALEHSRNRTFHYPYPTSRYPTDEELTDALRALGDTEARIVVDLSGKVKRYRFEAADRIAIMLSVGKHDPTRLPEQIKLGHDGAIKFVNFGLRLMDLYAETRGLEVDRP